MASLLQKSNVSNDPASIIEIVELIDEEDNLLDSFTRDLSQSHRELRRYIPQEGLEAETASSTTDSIEKDVKILGHPISAVCETERAALSNLKDTPLLSTLPPGANHTTKPEQGTIKSHKKLVKFVDGSKPEKPELLKMESAKTKQVTVDPIKSTQKPLRFRQRQAQKKVETPEIVTSTEKSALNDDSVPVSTLSTGAETEEDFQRLIDEVEQNKLREKVLFYNKVRYQNKAYPATEGNMPTQTISQPAEDIKEDESLGTLPSSNIPRINVAELDFSALGHDLETLVQAYDCGLFDEDEVENVVEKIEDFEKLNAMLESASLSLTAVREVPEQKEVLEDNTKPRSFLSDDDVMADVVENYFPDKEDNESDEYDEFFEYDPVQKTIFDRDIRQNYLRLKRELFPREGEEDDT